MLVKKRLTVQKPVGLLFPRLMTHKIDDVPHLCAASHPSDHPLGVHLSSQLVHGLDKAQQNNDGRADGGNDLASDSQAPHLHQRGPAWTTVGILLSATIFGLCATMSLA